MHRLERFAVLGNREEPVAVPLEVDELASDEGLCFFWFHDQTIGRRRRKPLADDLLRLRAERLPPGARDIGPVGVGEFEP